MASAPVQLIDLEEAKAQIYVDPDDTDKDADIELRIGIASSIVMKHIKADDIPESWIVTHSPLVFESPFDVKAATLLVFGELYANRESSTAMPLSDAVINLLSPHRMPTLA